MALRGGAANARLRVAIVGGGASGLLTAWLIQNHHDVTLYEADARLGGHVHTVPVAHEGGAIYAEAGFKYFFDRTNPHMRAVFDMLDLEIEWTPAAMTLPHPDVTGDLVIPPTSSRQLWHLLTAPSALRDIVCLSTLRKAYDEVVLAGDMHTTVRELLTWRRFPPSTHRFLYSFISSSWGAPADVMAEFPAYNVLTLLSSPGARYKRVGYLKRGSATYINALKERLDRTALRVGVPVHTVHRADNGWSLSSDDERSYDAVVLALPPWRAASILRGAADWQQALGRFRHFEARTAVHRDVTFMPRDRRDWSLSNVYQSEGRTMLTSWEGLRSGSDVFRSWLLPSGAPRYLERSVDFDHLIVDDNSHAHRRRIRALQGRDNLHAVGMYTGAVDCHESCVTSAVASAQLLAPTSRALQELVAAAESRAHDEMTARDGVWRRLSGSARVGSRAAGVSARRRD